ncbi:MAG: hypothetical protein EXQ85_08450 [Alphaproteobacteria bacterium]|nr:hypothetical protein [Alphaproteobacteria bacterium]
MDVFRGSSCFRFDGRTVECEGFTAGEGRIRQTMAFDEPPQSFVTHPVACDVWHFAGIDRGMGTVIQEFVGASCSPLPNGASGPMLGLTRHRFRYLGHEQSVSPAGTYETEHVQYVRHGGSVGMEAWCTPHDRLLVKMYFDPLKTTYHLAEVQGSVG